MRTSSGYQGRNGGDMLAHKRYFGALVKVGAVLMLAGCAAATSDQAATPAAPAPSVTTPTPSPTPEDVSLMVYMTVEGSACDELEDSGYDDMAPGRSVTLIVGSDRPGGDWRRFMGGGRFLQELMRYIGRVQRRRGRTAEHRGAGFLRRTWRLLGRRGRLPPVPHPRRR